MKYSNNYWSNKNERFKTSLQVVLIYAIVAALIALFLNFDKVIVIIKTLLKTL